MLRSPNVLLRVAVLASCLLASNSYAQDVDTTPPVLTGFDFQPRNIDVTAVSQEVVVTVQLTDDLSGASGAFIWFDSPSGAQSRLVFAFARIAGNSFDGTYQGTTTFQPFIESGAWTVRNIEVIDVVGNRSNTDTAALVAAGFPTQLFVVSNSDIAGPSLAGVTVTPEAVDVSAAAATVTVDLQLEDNLSGVIFDTPSSAFFAVRFVSPTANQSEVISSQEFVLVTGTITNGTWSGTARFPRYSQPGAWKIRQVFLQDAAGNSTSLTDAQLAALGFDKVVQVTSVPADTTPPNLVRLELTPTVIDTASGAQNVLVRMTITDDLAGVDFSVDAPRITSAYGVRFTSPSGGQTWEIFNSCCPVPQLVEGDPLNGVWQATIRLPQFSEAGTWRIAFASLRDTARNAVFLSRDVLEGTGIVDDLIVIRPSLVGDGTVGGGGGTVADGTFGDRASVTIPAGALSGPTTVAIDVFLDPLSVPMPQGFSAPGTRFVNIAFNPEPAFPLPAPGLTVVLPLVNAQVPGTPLALFRIEPSTGQLVASLDASGLPIVGTVDATGFSATFSGVVRLSTVVGLVPAANSDSAPPTIVCGQADAIWHAANVTVTCAAEDAGSGLADPGDASFQLSTSVASGDEQPNAFTNSREVCDVAGNCATAGPIGGNMIDRRAPSVAIAAPLAGAVFTQGEAVLADYTCQDHGSGLASCTGPVANGSPIDTSTTGPRMLTVTATDSVGNSASASVAFTVTSAAPTIASLIDQVGRLTLPGAAKRALTATLVAANKAVSRSALVARVLLHAFVLELRVLARRGVLLPAVADDLISQALTIASNL